MLLCVLSWICWQEDDPATETLPQATAAGEPENGNENTLDFTHRKGRFYASTYYLRIHGS